MVTKTEEAKDNAKQEKPAAACCESGLEPGEQADRIIRNHMIAAMGVGLLPIPVVDMVGVTGIQLNMLRQLACAYKVSFTEHRLKSTLTSLGSGGAVLPIAEALGSFSKLIPVIGTALGAVTMSITAGAVTYAVGKVFNQHFASGGTFLTFDPEKVKEYYAKVLEEGKAKAKAAAANA